MRLCLLLILLLVAISAAGQSCPVAEITTPVVTKPLIHSTSIDCDARSVPAGKVNECMVLRYLQSVSTDLAKELQDDDKRGQARWYTDGYFIHTLSERSDSFWRAQGAPEPRVTTVASLCDWLSLRVEEDKAAKDAKEPMAGILFTDRLHFSRDVPDPAGSTAGPFQGPFVLNVTNDRRADTTRFGAYGTIAYDLAGNFREGRWSLSTSIDSSTADKPSKSDIKVGLDYSRIFGDVDSSFQPSLQVSPKFLTDRDGKREAYTLTVTSSLKSAPFLYAGYYVCPSLLERNQACALGEDSYTFWWLPSLALESGHVVDAGGNPTLQLVEDQGTYVRLTPSIKMTWVPTFISPKVSLNLKYRHRFDLNEGWDRGFGEVSFLYNFTERTYFQALYRRGRKDNTFEPTNVVLLGFGISQ